MQDRLGTSGSLYPYGGGPMPLDGKNGFATYTRDASTGLDNAFHRNYHPAWGRFTTPDPYQASAAPADPQSWNRYAYVGGDPVNWRDQRGLFREASGPIGGYCATGHVDAEGSPLYVPCDLWIINNAPAIPEESRESGPGACALAHESGESLSESEYSNFLRDGVDSEGDFDDVAAEGQPLAAGDANVQALPVLAMGALTATEWVVYYAKTPQGQYYIGITSRFAARFTAHFGNVARPLTIQLIGQLGKLNYFKAKGVEQQFIESVRRSGSGILNRINSISPLNPLYGEAMAAGREVLDACKTNLPVPWN
jgi:RHS repeat-associated protein